LPPEPYAAHDSLGLVHRAERLVGKTYQLGPLQFAWVEAVLGTVIAPSLTIPAVRSGPMIPSLEWQRVLPTHARIRTLNYLVAGKAEVFEFAVRQSR
jgi:hypothetical protein